MALHVQIDEEFFAETLEEFLAQVAEHARGAWESEIRLCEELAEREMARAVGVLPALPKTFADCPEVLDLWSARLLHEVSRPSLFDLTKEP